MPVYYLFALGKTVVKVDGPQWMKRDRIRHVWVADFAWERRYYDASYDVIEIDYDEETERISNRREIKGFYFREIEKLLQDDE